MFYFQVEKCLLYYLRIFSSTVKGKHIPRMNETHVLGFVLD